MRKAFVAVLTAILLAAPAMVLLNAPVQASPGEKYSGPYFGDGNLPPGCIRDMSLNNPANACYHMRTGLNALDSPQVDVLVMVPVSPTVERDMRIMRQSIEMWEGGIGYLAAEMGLGWLAEGMDFHITVDSFDPTGAEGGEFTTYPIVDPEIVVIATNPVGGIGIGIDPVANVFTDENIAPCTGIQNPFDFEAWENVPGFNSHHESRTGTYTEDCEGAGGNICFAVNGAIDPAPETIDFFGLFDLVSHEVGHCLTVGHVGDGAEGDWGPVPTNDIMAYNQDPPGLNKCVSTLDVEGVAIRMSRYLDVNGDGTVSDSDQLLANDQLGDGRNAFQVQHPDDHLYASGTGSPLDCPQPDLGLLPGPRTDWTPEPVASTAPVMTVSSPQDGSVAQTDTVEVTGTVERVSLEQPVPDPTSPTVSHADAQDDASSPLTEIKVLDVAVTDATVEATISLAELWPSTSLASPTSYSLEIDGRRFNSFIRYAHDKNPMTWDAGASAYMPAGSSTWDLAAKTVSFHIPRAYLAGVSIDAPYYVASTANVGSLLAAVEDDRAPDDRGTVGVGAPSAARVVGLDGPIGANAGTVTFDHPEGNTFYPEDSTFGVPDFIVDRGTSDLFTYEVPQTSDVALTLTWTDTVGGTDLDLYVTGAASSGSDGASAGMPETVVLQDVKGFLDIRVEPYFVTDALEGSTYTLTAVVTAETVDTDGDGTIDAEDACPAEPGTAGGCPDGDGDGVADAEDTCPTQPGAGADGCPILATEHVLVYVLDADGNRGPVAGSQDVDTANGPDAFAITVGVAPGSNTLEIVWEDDGRELTSKTVTVTRTADADGDGVSDANDVCPGFDDAADADGDGTPDGCDSGRDGDGDGVADHADNCPKQPNGDQGNMDGDAKGDACDSDIDGDGHSNSKEEARGTDPRDPNSVPGKPAPTKG